MRRADAVHPIALLAHASPRDVVAYRRGRPIRAARFLADVARVATMLPPTRHVLNACLDRYLFSVGFSAAVVSGRVSLLPSTHTPAVIRQLQGFAPDAICLSDDPACSIELPLCLIDGGEAPLGLGAWRVPAVAPDALVAYVFTSGSTGQPLPHPKTWARLVHEVTTECTRLGFAGSARRAIVATVPPQHMYGFESSVLLALHGGHALCAERPFYPADIAAALAAVPAPRVLVSTPVHLKSLLGADVDFPALETVVSATAPLAVELAREVERRFGAPLIEIYGSTETGQIASRRTTETEEWLLWPGVRIEVVDGETWVDGGHVEARTRMGDVVEVTDERRFVLRGRSTDLVNIAGKRSSLAYLDHQLTSIPGVVDGAFVVREDSSAAGIGVARLAAVAVAPTLDARAITEQLRQRLDPVFLPRPLLLVPEIRRNATGKLPHHVVQALLGGR
jgi:acyl-coenzyme A synthetase/AMP-(fatty) acid ligase